VTGLVPSVVENLGDSRRFWKFYTRQFTDREFAVIMIVGIGIADVDKIVALGLDVWGKKQVLDVHQ